MAGRHRKPTHTRRNVATITASGAFLLPVAGVADARVPGPDADPPAARAAVTDPGRAVDQDRDRDAVTDQRDTGAQYRAAARGDRAAGGAAVAVGGVWDRLAQCESTGNWSINTGNGYSGGLQFAPSTWTGFGGREFAPVAHQATRAQQIIVATRVQARQGWGAWPACTRKLGISGTPPRITAAQGGARPSTKAQRQALGVRAADGTGRYVCDREHLRFESCDPGTIGQTVAYPPYIGRHRLAATPARGPASVVGTAPAAVSSVAAAARSYLGVPYRYGGTSRAGMDCSALVQAALRDVGIRAPRTARAQAAWARPISAAAARPGDLVFFYSPVSHVGIYLGNGRMIDSSRHGTVISVRTVYPGARYGRVPT